MPAIRALTRAAYAPWVPVIGREPRPMAADHAAAVRDHLVDCLVRDEAVVALVEMIPRADDLLIENLAVAPAHQGQGLGHRLLAHAEAVARGLGKPVLRLYTNAKFATNVAGYARAGFLVEREEAFAGGTVVHMAKALRPRTAPRLATARLTLRPPTLDDFADSLALWSDPAVVRFVGGRPFTGEEVWSRLLRYAGVWALRGFGYWSVLETATGRFVGEVGFADYRRDIVPPLGEAPEAGWVLMPWSHGRGFAGEALAAALAWADAVLDAPRTVCLIDPANRPSIALAGRHGYRTYAPGLYHGKTMVLFERDRPPGLG